VILYGQKAIVICDDGYIPEGSVPRIDLGEMFVSGISPEYESMCESNGNWSIQRCLAETCVFTNGDYSCGRFEPRTIADRPWLSETISPPNYIHIGQRADIICPIGHRIGSSSPSAPRQTSSLCSEECIFQDAPPCFPLTCGTFNIPSQSSVRFRDSTGQVEGPVSGSRQLDYNHSLLITCDDGHVLRSGYDTCEFETEVTCLDSGALTSQSEQCVPRPCEVLCSQGTRYAGPSGSANGCNEFGCPTSAPTSYFLPESCSSANALSRCQEERECTVIKCPTYPTPWNAQIQDASVVLGSTVTIVCNAGYVPEQLLLDNSTNLTGVIPDSLREYQATCENTGAWSSVQRCVVPQCSPADGFFSCGEFPPRTIGDRWWLEELVQPEGFIVIGSQASITCPTGHRMGSNNVGAPTSANSLCDTDCTFREIPSCLPVSCGIFRVPPNSQGRFRSANGLLGEAVNVSEVELFYGESVNVTCDYGHILAGQSSTCTFETEVTCLENGQLSMPPQQCVFQTCEVHCSVGTRYSGVSGLLNGCNNASCPVSAPRSFSSSSSCSVASPSRCEEEASVYPCIPVRCSSFVAPSNSVVEGDSLTYGSLVVSCNAGHLPEVYVPTLGEPPILSTSSEYSTQCNDTGTWTRNLRCLSDTCVVANGGFSCGVFNPRAVDRMPPMMQEQVIPDAPYTMNFIPLGGSVSIQCPPGTRVGSSSVTAARSTTATCVSDCNFEAVPTCQPVSCGLLQIPEYSMARKLLATGVFEFIGAGVSQVEVFFQEMVTITCNHTYAFANTTYQDCNYTMDVTCDEFGTLSEASIPECKYHDCREGITCSWNGANQLNGSVAHTENLVALYTETIDLRCAEGYRRTEGMCAKDFSPFCQRNGVFTYQDEAQCEVATCPALNSIDPYVVVTNATSTEQSYGTELLVSCINNYGAGGQPFASYTIVCGIADEPLLACQWNQNNSTQCERISCGQVPLPFNASVTETPNATGPFSGEVYAGDLVRVACDPGFRLSDSETCDRTWTMRCLENGRFDITGKVCEPVTCPRFSDPVDESSSSCGNAARAKIPEAIPNRQTFYDERVTLYCETDGSEEVIVCQDDCTLSPHELVCQPARCAPFEMFNVTGRRRVGGRAAPTTPVGAKVTIECEEGFELVEDWEGQPPGRMTVTLWKPPEREVEQTC